MMQPKKKAQNARKVNLLKNVIREAKCIIGPVVFFFQKTGKSQEVSINKKNVSRNTASRNDRKKQIFIWGMYQ